MGSPKLRVVVDTTDPRLRRLSPTQRLVWDQIRTTLQQPPRKPADQGVNQSLDECLGANDGER
jgi:hypothetical protein